MSRKSTFSYRVKTSDVPTSADADFRATQMAACKVGASLALFDSGAGQNPDVIAIVADKATTAEFVDTDNKETMFDRGKSNVNPLISLRKEDAMIANTPRQKTAKETRATQFNKLFNPVMGQS